MQLDVFTLVPHAFAWLTEQRPVATVLGTELFFEPTIIDDVTDQMTIAREETFGPVVPITPISSATFSFSWTNPRRRGPSTAPRRIP